MSQDSNESDESSFSIPCVNSEFDKELLQMKSQGIDVDTIGGRTKITDKIQCDAWNSLRETKGNVKEATDKLFKLCEENNTLLRLYPKQLRKTYLYFITIYVEESREVEVRINDQDKNVIFFEDSHRLLMGDEEDVFPEFNQVSFRQKAKHSDGDKKESEFEIINKFQWDDEVLVHYDKYNDIDYQRKLLKYHSKSMANKIIEIYYERFKVHINVCNKIGVFPKNKECIKYLT
eukprot:198217_1